MIIVPTEKRFDWKHTPVVLIAIVLINTCIFFLYQSDDSKKIHTAMVMYQENDFFKQEWPLFQQYLTHINDPSLSEYESDYRDNDIASLSYTMISRKDFYTYLKSDAFELIGYYSVDQWAGPRLTIHDQMMSVSYLAYGLQVPNFNLVHLITHQFLHGGLMHLLGNMVFLIICGFAVEAAIGHWRFLLFYIVSGAFGGLIYTLFQNGSYSTLVGASGSISGVMAMYLGIFRFKKIEFFYWFFVFVGYIRIPALLIFPFYVGKEIYSFYYSEGSNIAFMAHAGGFVAGALLVTALFFINRDMLNEEYIDGDQSEDEQNLGADRQELADIYRHLENYSLTLASQSLELLIKKNGRQFDLLLLRFKICLLLKSKLSTKAFEIVASTPANNIKEARQLHKAWIDNKNITQGIRVKSKISLASTFIDYDMPEGVEKIISELHLDNEGLNESIHKELNHIRALHTLSAKLSIYYGARGNKIKSQKYLKIAQNTQAEQA